MEERSMIERLKNQLDWSEDDMNKLLQELTEIVVEGIVSKETKNAVNVAPESEYELRVVQLLKKIGVPPHLRGYYYIKSSLIYYHETGNKGKPVTKFLYKDIADQYDTTAARVERGIRHAIELTYDMNLPELEEVCGNIYHPNSGKPTNLMFLSILKLI